MIQIRTFTKFVVFLLVVMLWIGQQMIFAQSKVVKPRTSEENLWVLDSANNEAKENVLIIVGFLGTEDTKKRTLKRRLHTVKAYLVDVLTTRNNSNFVVALSTESHKYRYGGIEIYVNGKLYEVLTSYKNTTLNLGPIASPDVIQWAPGLPKTRSGKIMRRILRKIASNEMDNLGDTSTLADPSVVDDLIANR